MSEPDRGHAAAPRSESAAESLPHKENRPGVRPLWIVVLALLLGAAALWGASRLAYVEVVSSFGVKTLTGAEIAQWHVPHAVLAVAAVAAILAVRGWPRRILGALLVVVAGWQLYATLDEAVLSDSRWSVFAPGAAADATVEVATWGPLAAVAGALLIGFAGVLLAWRGHRMPGLGAKYSAPGTKRARPDVEKEMWDALSEGDDPTRGP